MVVFRSSKQLCNVCSSGACSSRSTQRRRTTSTHIWHRQPDHKENRLCSCVEFFFCRCSVIINDKKKKSSSTTTTTKKNRACLAVCKYRTLQCCKWGRFVLVTLRRRCSAPKSTAKKCYEKVLNSGRDAVQTPEAG